MSCPQLWPEIALPDEPKLYGCIAHLPIAHLPTAHLPIAHLPIAHLPLHNSPLRTSPLHTFPIQKLLEDFQTISEWIQQL